MQTKRKDDPGKFKNQKGYPEGHCAQTIHAHETGNGFYHLPNCECADGSAKKDKYNLAFMSKDNCKSQFSPQKHRLSATADIQWKFSACGPISSNEPQDNQYYSANQFNRFMDKPKWFGFIEETVCQCKNKVLEDDDYPDEDDEDKIEDHLKEVEIDDPYSVVAGKGYDFPYMQECDLNEGNIHSL